MKTISKESPAIQLLETVWGGAQGGHGITSWERFNSSLQTALNLALSAQLHFNESDFSQFDDKFRFYYWCGNDGHMSGESYYAQAVQLKHTSACVSFETWKRRKPFIMINVTPFVWSQRQAYAKLRLALNSGFEWKGEPVEVTSFAADGTYIVACSYHKQEDPGYRRRKVKHLYKITHKMLKKERKFQELVAEHQCKYMRYNVPNIWFYDLCVMTFGENRYNYSVNRYK